MQIAPVGGRRASGAALRIGVLGLLACTMLAGCVGARSRLSDEDLPQATYYTVVVRPGDTLSDIAERYDCSAAEVARMNRLGSEGRIEAGQTLRIPVEGAETREAVLAEAGSSGRNYAPAPKPIDTNKFARRETISVNSLPPVVAAKRSGAKEDTEESQPSVFGGWLAAFTHSDADAPPRNERFIWPVHGNVISPFGSVGRGEKNDGINIAAAAGTPIRAAAAGTVSYAGNELKSYGNLVLIQHADGYVTAYAHAEKISVSRGAHVKKGEVIGLAGETGDVNRPQLHFEIRKDLHPVDPRLLLAAKD